MKMIYTSNFFSLTTGIIKLVLSCHLVVIQDKCYFFFFTIRIFRRTQSGIFFFEKNVKNVFVLFKKITKYN